MTPMLNVENLKTYFHTRAGTVRAVDGVSFTVARGEVLCIVGESGCGKSITAMSVLRLIPSPPGEIVEGRIESDGVDLLSLSEAEMRAIRGNRISMIFQEPMSSLNPVLTIGYQITEVLRLHLGLSRLDARSRAIDLLRKVQIPDPERRLAQYPHELSGGMSQRVMIAMAVACEPQIIIADEPTTALDVTIQAQVLRLLLDLRQSSGTAIILITHDLAVVAETADRVAVMYAGRIVEMASAMELFAHPSHPYTLGLLRSIPGTGAVPPSRAGGMLAEIPGAVPSLDREIPGCAFADRCSYARPRCREERPILTARSTGHPVACWEHEAVMEAVVHG
jgi:peptide/nickel transport system ATP-binding protein